MQNDNSPERAPHPARPDRLRWLARGLLVLGLLYLAAPQLEIWYHQARHTWFVDHAAHHAMHASHNDHAMHAHATHGDDGVLHAQKVYTELTRPEQIQVFNAVSDGIICQCGCHFVLSSCPHVECPWGIPVRRFMETQIRAGADAESLLFKLEHGFGESILEEPYVQQMISAGYGEIVQELVDGYGSKIKATASWIPLTALVALFALGAIWLGTYWLRRNRRTRGEASADAARRKAEADEAQQMLERYRNIDQ